MIKIKINRGKNSPPVDKTPVEFDTQSKVDGFGLTTPDNIIGAVGDPFRASSNLPRHAMEEEHCGCGCESCMSGEHHSEEELVRYFDEFFEVDEDLEMHEGTELEINEELLYEKKDRCYYLAKQKYDVFPSAYASGFIVRCRKGKVGRKRKKKVNEMESAPEYVEDLSGESIEEGTFDKEKSQGLRGWFARRGGKGKSKGWVDCNTCRTNPKTGRKTCKTCGRQSGEKRSKYPACRPTPSACTRAGTSRKKSSQRVSWKNKNK